MVDLIIPARYIHNPLWVLLWILLGLTSTSLNWFTLRIMIPYCERLIQQPSPRHSAPLEHHTRQRIKIYALISAIGVADIITFCAGLTSVPYSISAAKHSSSTELAAFHACVAVWCALAYIIVACLSVVKLGDAGVGGEEVLRCGS